MKNKVLVFEPEKCTGCRLCEQWCSMSHHGVVNPAKSRITITRHHETQVDYATYCAQCTDPACITACKFEAITLSEKTAAVLVDNDACTGCRACIRKCPYGAPSMCPGEKYIIICDLCEGDPQCVKHCPEQAIQYMDRAKADRLYRSVLIEEKKKINTPLVPPL